MVDTSLRAALRKQVEVDYGEHCMLPGNRMPKVRRLPTRTLGLDYITGGGFPFGMMTRCWGGFSSGKSQAIWNAFWCAQNFGELRYERLNYLAAIARMADESREAKKLKDQAKRERDTYSAGLSCLYVNAESTIDPLFLERNIGLKLDEERFEVINSTRIEEIGDIVQQALRAYHVIAVDSTTDTISLAELAHKDGIFNEIPMIRAQRWGKNLDWWRDRLSADNVLIYTSQIQSKVGMSTKQKIEGEFAPGGRKLDHDASVTLHFMKGAWLQRRQDGSLHDKATADKGAFGKTQAAGAEVVVRCDKNKVGKCLHEDEMVRMADGSVRAIKNLQPGDQVVGVATDGSSSVANVVEVLDQGLRDVYRHQFRKYSERASFVSTLDHKVLARPPGGANRPTPAGSLIDQWVTQRVVGFDPHQNGYDEEYATIFGLMLGDGHIPAIKRYPPQFTNVDLDVLDLLREALKPFGYRLWNHPSQKIQYRLSREGRGVYRPDNPLLEKFIEHGMNCKAHLKRVPEAVSTWSNDGVSKLLAGMILTDGTIMHHGPFSKGVGFCSSSPWLAAGFRDLLTTRFGAYGSIVAEHARLERRPMMNVGVGNYEGVRRIRDSIPLVGRKQELLDAVVSTWSGRRSDGANMQFDGREYLGQARTFDISIDNNSHLFALASGLVVSNSHRVCLMHHDRTTGQIDPLWDLEKYAKYFKVVNVGASGWVTLPDGSKTQSLRRHLEEHPDLVSEIKDVVLRCSSDPEFEDRLLRSRGGPGEEIISE